MRTEKPPIRRRLHVAIRWWLPASLLLVIVANLAFLSVARYQVSHGYWLEDKAWKALLLQAQPSPPEVVLIGSSRTQNHVDTGYFLRNGHRAFNFGVPGTLLPDYPAMVQHAADSGAARVVISLPAASLFEPPGCPRYWTWADVRFYAGQTPYCVREMTLKQWLQPWAINAYSASRDEDARRFPCQHTDQPEMAALHRQLGIDLCRDPRGVSLVRGDADRTVVAFANGDGLIVAVQPVTWQDRITVSDHRGQPFDAALVKRLRDLAAVVTNAGSVPVFVIESDPIDRQQVDKTLERITGVRTFYLNELEFPDDEIADPLHLGLRGNARYTRALYGQLFPAVLTR